MKAENQYDEKTYIDDGSVLFILIILFDLIYVEFHDYYSSEISFNIDWYVVNSNALDIYPRYCPSLITAML